MWISSYHFPHLLISNIGKTQEEYFVFTAAMSRQLKKCKELLSFDLVHKSLEENQQKEEESWRRPWDSSGKSWPPVRFPCH